MQISKTRAVLLAALLGFGAARTEALDTVRHGAAKELAARRWDVTDITFRLQPPPARPTDVEFSATFAHANGRGLEVPGFPNPGGEFVLRFTPPETGLWTYVTKSTVAGLNGRTGRIKAERARPGRKGGIVINPAAKRRFEYRNGEGYYPIAFECDWLFALDAENAADIPVTRKFVDQLAANGFNQVVMNVFAYDVTWKKDERLKPEHDYGSPRVFPFGGDNGQADHSRLNLEYFRRLDRVIDCLDKRGIAAHLMIYVWNKRVNWPPAKSAADNRYFDHVVRRYQAFPNLVWDVSKEALGYGHTDVTYIHDRIRRLRELDRHDRLITVHDYSYCRRFTDRVDFISVQLWGSELHGVMTKVRNDLPGKPILNIEHGGYERSPYVVFTGNYTSPEVCLERAWQCVFAGTYPSHYWQGAAWNVIIPDIESLPPGERPRLDYYRHLQKFVDRHDPARLVPGEKKSASGFCLHNNRDRFIYYVPKENSHIDVRLPKSARGKKMTGTWFNPFNGRDEKTFSGSIPQWPRYAKPAGDGFRILVVQIHPD